MNSQTVDILTKLLHIALNDSYIVYLLSQDEDEAMSMGDRLENALAELAALEQQGECEPVPSGTYNETWEILAVQGYHGHWIVETLPDGWKLVRRTTAQEADNE